MSKREKLIPLIGKKIEVVFKPESKINNGRPVTVDLLDVGEDRIYTATSGAWVPLDEIACVRWQETHAIDISSVIAEAAA